MLQELYNIAYIKGIVQFFIKIVAIMELYLIIYKVYNFTKFVIITLYF